MKSWRRAPPMVRLRFQIQLAFVFNLTCFVNASSTNSTLCAQPCYHQTVETHSCVSASCQVFAILFGNLACRDARMRLYNFSSNSRFVKQNKLFSHAKQVIFPSKITYFPPQNKLFSDGLGICCRNAQSFVFFPSFIYSWSAKGYVTRK